MEGSCHFATPLKEFGSEPPRYSLLPMSLLHTVKSHIPPSLLLPYHYAMARVAAFAYGNPSDKLVVIGVTGTKGKSSTVQMIAQLLAACGERVGYTSTAGFAINGRVIENRMKMTMPGRFFLQRMLRDMVQEECTYAVVETSSQGLTQFRHVGVNYDVAVFTNLTPEHIESHGGFENYKAAKGLLFAHLTKRPKKIIDGKTIDKTIVVNQDDEHAEYFASFPADGVVRFGWKNVQSVTRDGSGLRMTMRDVEFHVPLLAQFEQQNALCAIATLASLGIPLQKLATAASSLASVPGRFERITCGQPFTVVVDYAYEPASIAALIASVRALGVKRIIGVHGSAGGGRDVARRDAIGRLAGTEDDVVIVTNEDPYDDNPAEIINAVADGARAVGKVDNENLFTFDDRQDAINFAVAQAQPGDVVLVTGKGSEPVMAVAGGKKIAWDDRDAARRALAKAGYAL